MIQPAEITVGPTPAGPKLVEFACPTTGSGAFELVTAALARLLLELAEQPPADRTPNGGNGKGETD